tara:strand:- start:155 stop:1126 length:972 start_codon:yes stop_codon:yes gene_type:complete
MLPNLLNKNYIEKKEAFKEYCYIISKDKNNLMATELQNVLETKLRNEELKNLEGLFILDNKGNLYKIKDLEHDENFKLEIKIEPEEIALEEIKDLFVNNISKLINHKKDKIDDFLKNKIKEKIGSIENKKELFDLLLKERESNKKVDKVKLETINSIITKEKEQEEFKSKEKILTILLLLFLSYVIFSSLFITIAFMFIVAMFVVYIIIDKYRQNDFKLKEDGLLIDTKDKIIKDNDKKRIKFNENSYFYSESEYYKIINDKYNIKLTKVLEDNYLTELEGLVDFRLNEYMNLDNPFRELIENEIKGIKKIEINNLSNMFINE